MAGLSVLLCRLLYWTDDRKSNAGIYKKNISSSVAEAEVVVGNLSQPVALEINSSGIATWLMVRILKIRLNSLFYYYVCEFIETGEISHIS